MANILLIDDEAVLLSLISTALRLDGHDVKAVSDPNAAIESFDAALTPIDLLMTDIDMTPISGFELVRRLGKKGFKSSVLFMSGYSALAGAVADTLGPRALLEKPFTAPQLKAAVNRALSGRIPKTTRAA